MFSPFVYFTVILFLLNHELDAQILQGKFEKTSKLSSLKQKYFKDDVLQMTSSESPKTVSEDIESVDVLGITIPPEFVNDTVIQDHHIYYNSTFYAEATEASQYWIDLNSLSPPPNLLTTLSNSHRQATIVELSFDFPFYGHVLKNITIATGGFLYMGDYLHNWIAATQYVAPLMANFDTSQTAASVVKYADNGTAFTAMWENVYMQEGIKDGAFTFQVTLLKNGDIIFAYKNIPISPRNISDARHPVKVGISDAYILERSLFFVKRKTIYEYHRIDLLKRPISNNSAIYLKALPTCPVFEDCPSCAAADPKLDCSWCEAVKRCSDGIDRSRQAWVVNGCTARKDNTCPTNTSASAVSTDVPTSTFRRVEPKYGPEYQVVTPGAVQSVNATSSEQRGGETVSAASSGADVLATVAILGFVIAVIAIALWLGYAYKFPQTPSGQFLIKYRPSQWTARPKEDGSSVSGNARHF